MSTRDSTPGQAPALPSMECGFFEAREQVDLQLACEPYPLPRMHLNPLVRDLFGFKFEDFELLDYQAHPHIKAPVAV